MWSKKAWVYVLSREMRGFLNLRSVRKHFVIGFY